MMRAVGVGLLLFGCLGCDLVLGIKDLPSSSSSDAAGMDASADAPPMPATKLDLLLMIDNSSSMGEKQDLLAQALPELIAALTLVVSDIHVGVVTSALGTGGAPDICDPASKISAQEAPTLTEFNRHNDDQGHLINRKRPPFVNPPANGVEDTVTGPTNILAWTPAGDKNKFGDDVGTLSTGAGIYGCGLEAQMESWYRFLVQPDPYASISLDGSVPAAASLNGIDTTILQQRHDFLRPDSLLAVVMLTDEEDSWSDPMWDHGRGWTTRAQNNSFSTTGRLPPGTSSCPLNPMDPSCRWCGFAGTQNDPTCMSTPVYGPKDDGLNVRYTDDMKRRYGMNPQFPVERYVDGLTSPMVPDQSGEHLDANNVQTVEYAGRKNCRNPIFAQSLPTSASADLCNLTPGPRNPGLVLFGILGGVPPLLVKNATLTDTDWTAILGKDPAKFDQTGIDPHMIEAIKPRSAISCGPMSSNTCDAVHGRDWDTTTSKVGIDLQYACIFPLRVPIDCSKLPDGSQCDCGGSYAGPLCEPNPNDANNKTLQVRGKAYPTIRELRVAKALGANAVVGSLCATETMDTGSLSYGYRPFIRSLIARLTPLLTK